MKRKLERKEEKVKLCLLNRNQNGSKVQGIYL